ncbi:PucR family transcriptional regulator [Allokutzneria oryzae]|uniref:PucR family transcriptional regulator n=1 Tax=Allokutzneria oryzae TaxID=1378989 RepID=A0ABV6A8E3_9PSEU
MVHSLSCPVPAAGPVTASIDTAAVTELMADQVRDRIPALGTLAEEDRRSILRSLRLVLERAAQLAPARSWPSADKDFFTSFARRCAKGGLQFNEIITMVHTALWTMLSHFWENVSPCDHAVLPELHRWAGENVRTVLAWTTDGFRDAVRLTKDDAKALLAESVLRGGGDPTLAASTGLRLAERYRVLAVASDVVESARRVRQAFAAVPDVLVCPWGGAIVALCPADVETDTERLARTVRGAFPPNSVAVAAVGPVEARGAGAAGTQAHEHALLAKAVGMTDRVVGADDVLVERLLTANRDLAGRLADLIRPLAEHPSLLNTLESLYRNDLDRTATAGRLAIHRRTLAYRLDRVTELIGISPTSVRGVQLLTTALTAARLRGGFAPTSATDQLGTAC